MTHHSDERASTQGNCGSQLRQCCEQTSKYRVRKNSSNAPLTTETKRATGRLNEMAWPNCVKKSLAPLRGPTSVQATSCSVTLILPALWQDAERSGWPGTQEQRS